MKFFYDNSGLVAMIAENKIQCDKNKFFEISITPTEEEMEKIKSKSLIFVRNKKLEFEDNPQQAKEKTSQTMIAEISNAKTLKELQDVLIKIVPNLENLELKT